MSDLSPPLQRRSQATLDAISNATRQLLRTRSFTELTIQNIVTKAKSSAGAFYTRFKGKRALLHFLHEELARGTGSKQLRETSSHASQTSGSCDAGRTRRVAHPRDRSFDTPRTAGSFARP